MCENSFSDKSAAHICICFLLGLCLGTNHWITESALIDDGKLFAKAVVPVCFLVAACEFQHFPARASSVNQGVSGKDELSFFNII